MNNLTKEQKAESMLQRIAAPLGLSEWKCTDGKIYYSRRSAIANQIRLNNLLKDNKE